MNDLTVIFLKGNNHPVGFTQYHKRVLLEAIGDSKLIVVHRGNLDSINYKEGTVFIEDTGTKCHANMYFQLLQAAKQADTEFIATAEDDVLYSKEHFESFRPPENAVAYDMSRWSLFTWNPVFSLKQRVSNCTLIAPRKYLIEALEERFNKYSVEDFPPPLVSEVGRYEKNLGITERNMEKFYADVPCIQINHPNGTDSTGRKKKLGQIKAIEIPYWGRAVDIINLYA